MSLKEFCAAHRQVALAFSGGCDSVYLLSVLVDAGVDVRAYLVDTAFQPAFELRDAQRAAYELGVELKVLKADVLSQTKVCANSSERCYFCKHFIFGTVERAMAKDGYEILVDGTNASDDPSRRPGFKALAERGVLSPLRLAGLTKEKIRIASAKRGLFTWEKPNFSCLATKIKEGERITLQALEEASQMLENEPWNISSRSR